MSAETIADAASMVAQFRQALQGCSSHEGPASVAHQALIRRERRMMRFVAALFDVDDLMWTI